MRPGRLRTQGLWIRERKAARGGRQVAGSRRQFQHPEKPGTVTVSGELGVDLPPGTLRSALKQAGLE
ncbi:MAG: type II toxin-antitoxin system HicA family toxin [Planctomycetes bacterium]|nr:type II toxin-antitoxin system HicA family toxin [Planctomycetota bacterium]